MKKLIAKGLEALGIACLLIGLAHGIASGDMWGELYYLIAGLIVFYGGRTLERTINS